ncbi:hypothetical protein MMC25_004790 [Agyrium rufum]|nr:hypothetical protein [Agyrium rufum]
MSEKQPDNVREGADVDDETTAAVPTSAEERKAAAALSSLDVRGEDESKAQRPADSRALDKAISQLNLSGGDMKKKDESKSKETEVKKKVKVDAADVALLVDELDLSRPKATELLKAHDGDAIKAMTAFIVPVN